MRYIVLSILCFAGLVAHGQKWYVCANAGYGMGMQKAKIGESVRACIVLADLDNYYEKDYVGSLGNGFYTNVCAGYTIDSSSFVETGIRFWYSTAVNSHRYIYNLSIDKPPLYFQRMSNTAQNVFATFSYGLKFQLTPKWQLITKAGIMLGKNYITGTSTLVNDSFYTQPPGKNATYKYEYYSPMSLGGLGSIGVNYKLNKKLSLTADIFFQLQSARVYSRTTTEYTLDGQNKWNELTENQKKVTYYNGKPTTVYFASDIKGQQRPLTVPMSAWGITIGVMYAIGK